MKFYFLLVTLLLSACSTCNIPYEKYESYGGSESFTSLALKQDSYTLTYEHWKPTEYEKRSRTVETGKWTCHNNLAEFHTPHGSAKAQFQNLGNNPLGLAITTKALVFEASESDALSRELFYPAKSLE